MSLTSFYTALTGLNNNAMAINVIGNNLANINTTAFKSSKTNFAELLAGLSTTTAANGNPIQIGVGSTVQGVSPVFSQGSIAYTGRNTDAAISGNGFFVVSIGDGLGYTRCGTFGLTREGHLSNSEGFHVMGYAVADGAASNNATLAPIMIEKGGSLPPRATTAMSMSANLDSQVPDGTEFNTSMQIFDSLGTAHLVTISFTKTAVGQWTWTATIPATDTGGAASDPPVQVGTGTLTFDGNGVLTGLAANPSIQLTGLASGATDQTITFGILDENGSPRMTSYSSPSSVSSTIQDGSPF
ncbi:MAG: flagellar hook-basal body complex protein, partial [Acidobacteria bacterium]|nr:flagellar hook-basal body complex protein [Acidobacteriota bacterium]